MLPNRLYVALCLGALSFTTGDASSQEKAAPQIAVIQVQPAPAYLAPIMDAATTDQIREYLRVSGTAEDFRTSWIAAVDKNRSLGYPYWPEAFWTSIKLR